jgi:hypothetical protein
VTHWPALVPAIERASHEAVLVEPLEYGEGGQRLALLPDGRAIIASPDAPPVVIGEGGEIKTLWERNTRLPSAATWAPYTPKGER